MRHAIDRVRRGQHRGGAQPDALDRIIAEMLVEPRPPYRAHAIAGLQQGPHPRTGSAAHQTEVTAVAARQQFDNGAGFAVPPHPQYDAFVRPFHGRSLQDSVEGRSYPTSSFRGDAQHRTRNLEIPGSRLRRAPGMTMLRIEPAPRVAGEGEIQP